jgi:hypothetical protein
MRLRSAVLALGVFCAAMVAQAATPDISVLPALVRGVVIRPDGETPVKDMPVRLWNADTDEVVYKTRTDGDGVFEVPSLREGNQYITVGPVRIEMRVLTARGGVTPQTHGVVVVVPKRMSLMPLLVPSLTAGVLPEIMSP